MQVAATGMDTGLIAQHSEVVMSFPEPFYRWRPHPWHGLDIGSKPPRHVNAYIEITPFDFVKYEIDKTTGYMRVDRPQQTSSQPPTLYGFVPRTFCSRRVHALCETADRGDLDPLDICVISERPITRAEVILRSRVLGGIKMIDGGEADDKIIAVLENDTIWGNVQDIKDLPEVFTERLRHYFATYKMTPSKPTKISIEGVYGCDHACQVVEAAVADYNEEFGQ
jgi:inorganic pyrophosphatase